MAIYNTADDTNNFIKQGTSNNDSYYIDNTKVSRLGFNPTETIKIEEKRVA